MHQSKYLFFILILIFFNAIPVFPADIYLTDFSGQTGPAPSPAPYATTYLYLNNAPNDISQFSLHINYDPDVLSVYSQNIKDGIFKDWDYTLITRVSGSHNYIILEGWTLGPPVSAGSSGLIAELIFKVNQNIDSSVWLNDLQNDIQAFTTGDANFTYIPDPDAIPPVANAGPDQAVFKSVTLNGSDSTDDDNLIESWEWELTHRSNSSYKQTANGEIVSLNNLMPGFYDVVLTVKDETGLSDTDNALISVLKSPVTLSLKKSWNLVSIVGDESINISDFISGYENSVLSIWVYKDGNWYVNVPDKQEFSDLFILSPGEGFWINCANDITLEY